MPLTECQAVIFSAMDYWGDAYSTINVAYSDSLLLNAGGNRPPAIYDGKCYMTTESSKKTADDKKYPYTKQLVRIAVQNGCTNEKIAVKAGLSGKSISQVSRWRNGEALATERQMRALINEFGHQLKRQVEHLIAIEHDGKQQFALLQGDLLLKHNVRLLTKKGKVAIYRVLLLKDDHKFVGAIQSRFGLTRSVNVNLLAHSDNEDANWQTILIRTSTGSQEIVSFVDEFIISIELYKQYEQSKVQDNERKVLGYKIRQVLLRAGYAVEDLFPLDLSACEIHNTTAQ